MRKAKLSPLVSASIKEAEAAGRSLALIRPRNTRVFYKAKKPEEIAQERRLYPRKGMLFCVGNMAKRHHTWQLLGVLRVDDTGQTSLF